MVDKPNGKSGGADDPRSAGSSPPEPAQYPPGLSESDRALWAAFERLSERERRYLRYSAQGYTSKDIALIENGHDKTISKVIERARIKCGGVLRRDLSRKYAEWESWRNQALGPDAELILGAETVSESLAGQSFPVASGNSQVSQRAADHRDDGSRQTARRFAEARPASPTISLHLPVGIGGSGRNDLSISSTSLAILLIATVSVMFAVAILMLLFTADHIQLGP